MDRARIEEYASVYVIDHKLCGIGDLVNFAEHIAKIAREEALEEAAVKSWSVGMDENNRHQGLPHDCREVGAVIAKQIRALKEKS